MSFIHVKEQEQQQQQEELQEEKEEQTRQDEVGVEEEEHEDSPNLCQRCKELDLDRIFIGPRRYSGPSSEMVLSLGILDKDSPCGLCRFFYSMRRPSLTGETTGFYHLRKYILEKYFSSKISPGRFCYAVWAVDAGSGYQDLKWGEVEPSFLPLNARPYLCFLPHSTVRFSYPRDTLEGLPVPETSVNYPLLRHWIKKCEGHWLCNYLSSDLTKSHTGPTIRVIDCETRHIVDLEPGDRYIALSYVWGNKPLLENKGSRVLPTNAPKVVEDAMVVVKELGQQYLWVDQYCINQHDDQDKHAQIKNMDRIYEGSHATIVAFSGVDSSSGLPGVSSTPRIPQHRFTSSKVTLVGFTPSITRQSSEASIWMKRGWTFQEALLSRRLLIFTQEQTYFLCSRGWWAESCTPTPHMTCLFETDGWRNGPLLLHSQEAMRSISPLTRSPSQNPVPRFQVDFGLFHNLLEGFTRRQLSFQSDALDAVRGLLSRVPVLTYWGIPVHEFFKNREGAFAFDASETNDFFLGSLFWQPDGTATDADYLGRREGFPSWSWLGWRIPVAFPKLGDFGGVRSIVKVENADGTLLPISDLVELFRAEVERSRMLPERTSYLWLEGLVLTLGFQPLGNRHGGEICFCLNHPLGHSDYPCLMKGSCSPKMGKKMQAKVRFRLDVKGSEEKWRTTLVRKWNCLWIDSVWGGLYFLILDEGDDAAYNCVGTLYVRDETMGRSVLEKLKAKVPHEQRKVRIG